jgi:signal transduction histidine kinase
MSASLQAFHKAQDQDVLGELLHSLSQPLTSLRCSLELSIDDIAGRQQEAIAGALQQAERVIGMVKLMREYLDTEPGASPPLPVPLIPTLCAVVDQLCSVAMVRQIRIHLAGTGEATIPVPEPRLSLALQYLIGSIIEAQPANREILLWREEDALGFMLRAQVRHGSRLDDDEAAAGAAESARDPVRAPLQRVKFAIASRVFESGGASLSFDSGDSAGFVLRVPRPPAPPAAPELFS